MNLLFSIFFILYIINWTFSVWSGDWLLSLPKVGMRFRPVDSSSTRRSTSTQPGRPKIFTGIYHFCEHLVSACSGAIQPLLMFLVFVTLGFLYRVFIASRGSPHVWFKNAWALWRMRFIPCCIGWTFRQEFNIDVQDKDFDRICPPDPELQFDNKNYILKWNYANSSN